MARLGSAIIALHADQPSNGWKVGGLTFRNNEPETVRTASGTNVTAAVISVYFQVSLRSSRFRATWIKKSLRNAH